MTDAEKREQANSQLYYNFNKAFTELARRMKANADAHGFETNMETAPTKLALIHSEISEALEALRNNNPADKHLPQHRNLTVELADAVIRIMSLAAALELPLADAILDKMAFNAGRPHKHGGKKF